MTTTSFTALIVMIACLLVIAIGFYYMGYQKGKEGERHESK